MKKSFFGISSLMVALLWPMAPAQAQYTGPGAVQAITSLQQVLERPVDGVAVVLRGQLVRQLSADKYVFSDGKQEIRVDIDRQLFPAQPVTASTTLELVGEVEKDYLESPETDVDLIRVVR